MEKRFIESELRAVGDGRLTGYAAVYDSVSEDLGGFREIIAPGAFDSVLGRNSDVRALVNHDTSKVLGRTVSQTLSLESDDRGLAFDIDLPNTVAANDLAVSVERGDVSGASFAFNVDFDDYDIEFNGGEVIRIIRNIAALYEISVVTFPAYAATEVSSRHLQHILAKKPGAKKDLYDLKIELALL